MKDWGIWPSILSDAGIGQSFLNYESKSSSGADFKTSVTSLDFSKTYVIEELTLAFNMCIFGENFVNTLLVKYTYRNDLIFQPIF